MQNYRRQGMVSRAEKCVFGDWFCSGAAPGLGRLQPGGENTFPVFPWGHGLRLGNSLPRKGDSLVQGDVLSPSGNTNDFRKTGDPVPSKGNSGAQSRWRPGGGPAAKRGDLSLAWARFGCRALTSWLTKTHPAPNFGPRRGTGTCRRRASSCGGTRIR